MTRDPAHFAEHAARSKRDSWWFEQRLVGLQEIDANAGEYAELRDCCECGSTITRAR